MNRSRATAFLSVLAGVTVMAAEPATASDRYNMSDSSVHTHTSPFQEHISCAVEYFYQLNPDTHRLRIFTQVGPNQATHDFGGCRIPGATHTYVRATYFNTDRQEVTSQWFAGASTIDVTIPNVSELYGDSGEPAVKTDHYATWDECIENCTSPVYSLMGGVGKN